MLPEERRRHIWQRLKTEETVRTRDLATEFDVSNLTIHRDLQRLAQTQPVVLVRGGALFRPEPVEQSGGQQCRLCQRPLQPHQALTIVLADGQRMAYCCAHCGLFQWPELREEAKAVLATDILHGSTLNALSAWFVVGPEVNSCCTPTVYAFASRDHAERFQRGFGGQVVTLEKAVAAVHSHMRPD